MSDDRSRAGLLKFLDYVGEKGLINPTTARMRKAAANQILSILSDDEAQDITKLDLDLLLKRFANLEGQKYTPGSLGTYQSRLKSSLEDFNAYLANPLGFRTGTQSRDRKPKTKTEQKPNEPDNRPKAPEPPRYESPPPSSSIMPIQLRPNLTVHIQGLPFDLTEVEARKLANVILALAMPSA